MTSIGRGIITPNGVSLEKHENDTVVFFTELGYNIELIPPSHIPGVHTPDFRMNGVKWEMKGPRGRTRSNLEHAFQAAMKQSTNIIIDLRRIQMPERKAIKILEQIFGQSKSARRLLVVTKDKKLLDYEK